MVLSRSRVADELLSSCAVQSCFCVILITTCILLRAILFRLSFVLASFRVTVLLLLALVLFFIQPAWRVRIKLGTHYPCSRTVFMFAGREDGC